MWNSTSKQSDKGVQYNLPDFDAIINFIGYLIELNEDSNGSPLAKDDTCDLHYSAYLNGITNGEYIYAIFEILGEMTSPNPVNRRPSIRRRYSPRFLTA